MRRKWFPAGKRIERYISIEDHWEGGYRIGYDGKYITLFGKDSNYPQFNFEQGTIMYEEMVLIPVVVEIRNAKNISVKEKDEIVVIEYFIDGK